METFNVNEYQNLGTTSKIIKTYINKLNDDNTEISKLIDGLNDSNIFMGPTCDELIRGWEILKSEITNKSTELSKYADYLNLTEFMYKEMDSKNSSDISNV